jgi:hypothetical protein
LALGGADLSQEVFCAAVESSDPRVQCLDAVAVSIDLVSKFVKGGWREEALNRLDLVDETAAVGNQFFLIGFHLLHSIHEKHLGRAKESVHLVGRLRDRAAIQEGAELFRHLSFFRD